MAMLPHERLYLLIAVRGYSAPLAQPANKVPVAARHLAERCRPHVVLNQERLDLSQQLFGDCHDRYHKGD